MSFPKSSPASRGYGWAWTKLRETIMRRDAGLCQPCRKKGFITKAVAVDHIMRKEECKRLGVFADAPENLQGICKDCHDEKTAIENGGHHIKKNQIGADGWPIK